MNTAFGFLVPKFLFGNALVGRNFHCVPSFPRGTGVGNGNCLSNGVPKWKFGNKAI